MAEELRIIIDDGGVPSGGSAPAAPGPGGRGGGIPVAPPSPPSPSPPGQPSHPGGRAIPAIVAPPVQAPPSLPGAPVGPAIGVAAVGGQIAIAAAGFVAGLGVSTAAIVTFARKVESETQRLAGFSPELAVAQSMTEIRRQGAMMRRAQRIGGGLAAVELQRARFEEQVTELGTNILQILLQILEKFDPLIELVIKATEKFNEFMEQYGRPIGDAAWETLKTAFPALRALDFIANILRRWTEDKDQALEQDPFMREFMSMLPHGGAARGHMPLFWPGGQGVPVPGFKPPWAPNADMMNERLGI